MGFVSRHTIDIAESQKCPHYRDAFEFPLRFKYLYY